MSRSRVASRASVASLVAASLAAASIAACAGGAPAAAPSPAPARSSRPAVTESDSARSLRVIPTAVRWARLSAEHRGLYLASYRLAAANVERYAAGKPAGSWAVILDADETVLDNVQSEIERARAGMGYNDSAWVAWVRRAEAPALPGSAAFLARVRALGGRAVLVTNRADSLCADTRRNVERLSLAVDAVLCAPPPPQSSDKNPRFEAVARGVAGLPPLEVLMWVGDNIQDFPHVRQHEIAAAPDSAYAEIGSRWILLPNAMYGSWDRVPVPAR